MPFIEHTGVSRRIENEDERARLKDALNEIRLEGKGVIARTVAEGQSLKHFVLIMVLFKKFGKI